MAVCIFTFRAQRRVLVGVPGFVPDPPARQARAAPLSCDEAAIYAGSREGDAPVAEGEEFERGQ